MHASAETLADAYLRAVNLARQGRLAQADSVCREILRRQPHHQDTLMLRGVIELQSGRSQEACDSFGAAIVSGPAQPVAHALLGDALLQDGAAELALDSYQRALQVQLDLVPALFGRGNAL